MAKRDILRAAARVGLDIKQAKWEWTPTPGESVPVWSIYFTPETADKFEIDSFRQFSSTSEAVEWIGGLQLSEESSP